MRQPIARQIAATSAGSDAGGIPVLGVVGIVGLAVIALLGIAGLAMVADRRRGASSPSGSDSPA